MALIGGGRGGEEEAVFIRDWITNEDPLNAHQEEEEEEEEEEVVVVVVRPR